METNNKDYKKDSPRQKKDRFLKALSIIVIVIIGIFIFVAGYLFIDYRLTFIENSTHEKVSLALSEIQETNAMNFNSINSSLDSIYLEMEEINYLLTETDESIELTTSAQETLMGNIQALEEQMEELQKGMELLMDAYKN